MTNPMALRTATIASTFLVSIACATAEDASPPDTEMGSGGTTTVPTVGAPTVTPTVAPTTPISGPGPSTGTGANGSTVPPGGGGSTSSGCPQAGGTNDAPLLDDMEDGNSTISSGGGRLGYWYAFNDGTAAGMQTPASGADFMMSAISGSRDSSTQAAHTSGSGFADFAGMGFSLLDSGGKNCPYDASGYTGIRFWARGNVTVRLSVQMPDTVPSAQGGTCSAMCFDTHGAVANLTNEWQPFEFEWSELGQQNFGAVVTFDAARILAIQFQTESGNNFDFWVDDIEFMGGSSGGGGSTADAGAGMDEGDAAPAGEGGS